ncbi:MAG: hypothetical protein ACN0LA_07600 [Candidatus Longimicrobiales bacterium M2_2A_002]
MTSMLGALVLPGLLALGGPPYIGGPAAAAGSAFQPQAATRDTLTGPGGAVPFVAQGPLLCGGASAAMIERWWGALGVYADDYAALVSRGDGGIKTGALAGAMEARGYDVRVFRDDPAAALAQVRADHPVIALIESGDARYHYVVLIAVGPDRVRYHDPLKGPGRTVDRAGFMRRWAAAGHWAMMATPAPTGAAGSAGSPTGAPDTTPPARPDTTPLPSALRRGLEALRAGRSDSASTLVTAYLRRAPADAPRRDLAWEMLATARYLAGDPLSALSAWNRVGQPPVDLVHVRGIDAIRHSTVTDAMGIRPRTTLTPGALGLARRRVQQLPAVRRSRVGYRPLRDGSVAVEAFVLERRRVPLGVVGLAVTGLGAAVNRDAALEAGPLLPLGERWRIEGSWREARSLAEGAVVVPWSALRAVATLRAGWAEERYGADLDDRSRTWGLLSVDRWITAGTRLGATVGLERWDGGDRLGRAGFSALRTLLDDRVRFGAAVDGWAGPDGRFGRARTAARVRVRNGLRAWTLTLGGSWTSTGAPPTIRDGAGTGQIRAPLLRGHPLIRDGRIRGDALGRGLVHGTLAWGWHLPAGPATASLELFVDGARVWAPLGGGGPRSYADPGIEMGISSPTGAVALALARGDDEWVFSARVDAGGLPWLAVP